MKHIYLLFLLFTTLGFSQIPAGYYDDADRTGYDLKHQLYDIIKGHTDNGYGGLYTTYSTSDRDNYFENNGTILDMYSENPSGLDSYEYTYEIENPDDRDSGSGGTSEGEYYNREHIIPQGIFSSASPMRNDAHFVVPSDKFVNAQRGSFPFGVVDTPNWTSTNGSKRGNNLNSGYSAGYSSTVFEPIDEFKGDIARMYFYFVTRYENLISGYTYDMFDGTHDHAFDNTFLNILLQWHSQDPVSQREIDRNDAIYNRQSNRNPYIDHPEYVGEIWTAVVDEENPTDPTNLVASNPTGYSIDIDWTASTDDVGVISYDVYIDGVFNFNTTNTNSATASGLTSETNYCFTLKAKDGFGNESGFSNQDCEMTTVESAGPATELFFSEYVEGSSFNKALEIVNLTGSVIDLSTYSIKRNSNGGASWDSPLNLTGNISAGDVYVIINSDAPDATLQAQADLTINNVTPMTFNGDDPIGLFKNDVLIDMIGEFNNGGGDFAKDITFRRKNSVSGPNTTFLLVAEWDSYAQNTVNDIGMHTSSLNLNSYNLETIRIFPNPTKNGFVKISTTKDLNIIIYDILGKQVLTEKVTSSQNSINISNLNKGMYLVKLISDYGEVTKKLIKQ